MKHSPTSFWISLGGLASIALLSACGAEVTSDQSQAVPPISIVPVSTLPPDSLPASDTTVVPLPPTMDAPPPNVESPAPPVVGNAEVHLFRERFIEMTSNSPIAAVPTDENAKAGDISRLRAVASLSFLGSTGGEAYVEEIKVGAPDLDDYAIELWLHVPVSAATDSGREVREVVYFLATQPQNSDRLVDVRRLAAELAGSLRVGTPIVLFVELQPTDIAHEFGPGTYRAPLDGFIMADGDGLPVTLALDLPPGEIGELKTFEAVVAEVTVVG